MNNYKISNLGDMNASIESVVRTSVLMIESAYIDIAGLDSAPRNMDYIKVHIEEVDGASDILYVTVRVETRRRPGTLILLSSEDYDPADFVEEITKLALEVL